jgi:hypothetical protein
MEEITRDIRRGLPWVVVPLAAASLLRLGLERQYFTPAYLGWLLLIPLYFFLLRQTLRRATPARIRLALLINFAGINAGYTMIGVALNSARGWRADDFVYGLDRLVFGRDPQQWLVHVQAPWLSTVAMLGYLLFAGYLFYIFLSEAFTLSDATGRLQLGIMRLYGLGFSGYLLLPAAGPAFHHPALLPPIAHSDFTARLQPWVLDHCSHVDVCPSIHAAVCCFVLIWSYHRRRPLFYFLLGPSAALLLATVYFQYHYFADLPFGLLLGAGAALPVSHAHPPALHRPAGATG